MDSSASFEPALDYLRDLQITLFDRRGWGASATATPPAESAADHADDLAAVVGSGPAVVIGHSVGGVVALHAAVRHPELVASLGLYEPAVHWAEWWTEEANAPVVAAVATAASDVGRATDDSPEQVEQRAYLSDLRSTLESPVDLGQLVVPVVIGYGTRSDAAHQLSARRLAEVIGADLVPLDGCRHNAHRTHPEAFARFVRAAVTLAQSSGRTSSASRRA
jgi:pimeloyl-ACP methyl ester carboxylesterase